MCAARPDLQHQACKRDPARAGPAVLTDVFLRGPRAYRSLSSYRSERGNSRKTLEAREKPRVARQRHDARSWHARRTHASRPLPKASDEAAGEAGSLPRREGGFERTDNWRSSFWL